MLVLVLVIVLVIVGVLGLAPIFGYSVDIQLFVVKMWLSAYIDNSNLRVRGANLDHDHEYEHEKLTRGCYPKRAYFEPCRKLSGLDVRLSSG